MKKIVLILLIVCMFFQIAYADGNEVEVVIPDFTVKVNGEIIKTVESQYPVISYKNITYFPMTSDYLNGIGLTLAWSKETGIKIGKKDSVTKLDQKFLGATNTLKSKHKASLVNYQIEVNGKVIDNLKEDYPVLSYKNITYFPMTWKFAVTEFGWQTKWSNEEGFEILINKENLAIEGDEDIVVEYPIDSDVTFIGNLVDTNPKLDWNEIIKIEKNLYLNNTDFSQYDFSDYNTIKKEMQFHNDSTFSKSLPEFFDPEKILKWGNTPMLGIQELHSRGITGEGVNIAYIDQSLRLTHESLESKNIYYTWVDYDDAVDSGSSMHGIAVADLIVGENVGAAPDANLYFYGHPAYYADQKSHAQAIYEVIEQNKTLEDKIRVIGFSDNIDDRERNPVEFEEAVKAANDEGILVLFADNGRATIDPMLNRNDPNNYEAVYSSDKTFYPVTYTIGNGEFDNHYTYYPSGGTSWTTPVAISLVAMALQVDPDFDVMLFEEYIDLTAFQMDNMKLVNPVGFIELVEEMKAVDSYYCFLYNSNEITDEDLNAINTYADQFELVNLIDTFGYTSQEIYNKLKLIDVGMNKNLKGIQIFGTDLEVPAFRIHDKVDMGEYGIHDAGTIVTDHFYGNFDNDASLINEELSMYSIFGENIDICFDYNWPVVRLPVQKGEIKAYFDKYNDFNVNDDELPVVNFSNPIFASNEHTDDYGYFIKERLDKDFGILDESDYRLYGNLKGAYPVKTDVLGDLTAENVLAENKKGPMNLVINSHGQVDNIDRAYYLDRDNEKRESFLNNDIVNDVLGENYYNLFQWTCWGSAELGNMSINQHMISEGKAINIISSSYLASNNGINVYDDLNDLKSNNGMSLFYHFMLNLYGENHTWSDSFKYAKEQYVVNNLSDTSVANGEGNYQFNMNNAIMFSHLGLLDSKKLSGGLIVNFESDKETSVSNDSENQNRSEGSYPVRYENNQLEYSDIEISSFANINEIEYVGIAVHEDIHYLKLSYDKVDAGRIVFFLAGDAPGLSTLTKDLPSGKGTIIVEIPSEKYDNFEENIVINTNGNKACFHFLKSK